MHGGLKLEACAYNLDSCIIAERSGAHRIELCVNAAVGGTTPPYELIKQVKYKLAIPVYPIIRPRGGDFLFSDEEFSQMSNDILACKELGCEGIATGIHLANKEIDTERMKRLVELAYPMRVTCHRVFDRTPDPFKALEDLIDCGCERILTSGQKDSAAEATEILSRLVKIAVDRIIIMPGGGVRSSNIEKLVKETGAKEFHTSAITNKTEMIDENELMMVFSVMKAIGQHF